MQPDDRSADEVTAPDAHQPAGDLIGDDPIADEIAVPAVDETEALAIGEPVDEFTREEAEAIDAVVESSPLPPHVRPKWAPATLVAFVGLVVCTNIASAVWARWIDTNPEGLLMLSARSRYLALVVAAGVSLPAYIVIAGVRLAMAFVVCHLIGRAYGPATVRWFTRYLGVAPESVETFNRYFAKGEWAIIPWFAGSNIVAVLSGVHRTSPFRLAILLGVGIAGRLALFWWLAKVFEEPLVSFLEWLQKYQWWAVGLSILAVVIVNARNLRRA